MTAARRPNTEAERLNLEHDPNDIAILQVPGPLCPQTDHDDERDDESENEREEVVAMPPPGGCARGGGQWAGTHGPPRSVPARRVEEHNGTQ